MSKFNFDYNQTMMMKINIANPDNKGGSKIFNTFEQALKKIQIIDNLTFDAPKIIYLVGWQYLGHDDRYPAFFEVNEYAKRQQDKTAIESLLWLVEEAKKYHTTVSLHINLSDAYPDSPLWEEYIKNDLILRNSFDKLKVIGVWNGRKAYQVRFKQEYESGYFKARVDRLLKMLPLTEIGTVHIDAFFVRKGKDTLISEEKKYRRKMIEYFMEKGIDVTSEFIYREQKNGYRSLWGKSDIIGLIPAIWNLRMTQKDYMRYPSQVLAGGKLNMDLQWDKNLQYLFYGNCHGEESFNLENWEDSFVQQFSLQSVPYIFLNQFRLQKISGFGKGRKAHFTENVVTAIRDKRIIKNNIILKRDDFVCLPVPWLKNTYYLWSETGGTKEISTDISSGQLYEVNPDGQKYLKTINGNTAILKLDAGQGYLLKGLTY